MRTARYGIAWDLRRPIVVTWPCRASRTGGICFYCLASPSASGAVVNNTYRGVLYSLYSV
eukprot:scaffold111810_cov112-Phaeocystis_antarctica.AAC.1